MNPRVIIEMEVDDLMEFVDTAVPLDGTPTEGKTGAACCGVDLDRMVILEPDVAAVFHNSQQVNTALRALLQAIPKPSLAPPTEAAA